VALNSDAVRQIRQKHYFDFWTEVLKAIRIKSLLFDKIAPRHNHWIGTSSNLNRVQFNFGAAQSFGRAEIYIDRRNRSENKQIFDALYANRSYIETSCGYELTWERLDNRCACRIKSEMRINSFERENWLILIPFMTEAMVRLESSFQGPLEEIAVDLGL